MQSLGDQEIISHLDIRSQECENQLADMKQEYAQMKVTKEFQEKALQVELNQLRLENQSLKSRLEASETNYKGQKKVLVKEVKSLRAQLDAVTAERNKFAGQIRVITVDLIIIIIILLLIVICIYNRVYFLYYIII